MSKPSVLLKQLAQRQTDKQPKTLVNYFAKYTRTTDNTILDEHAN